MCCPFLYYAQKCSAYKIALFSYSYGHASAAASVNCRGIKGNDKRLVSATSASDIF